MNDESNAAAQKSILRELGPAGRVFSRTSKRRPRKK